MKLKTILCASILFGMQFSWAANDKATPTLTTKNSNSNARIGINVEPVWLVLSGIGAKFEYFVTDTVSVGLGGTYIPEHQVESTTTSSSSDSSTKTSITNYKWSYNEVNLGANIMLTGTLASRGLYLNPGIGYQNTRISDYSEFKLQGSLSSPQLRLTVGYQWVFDSGLRLAAGGGFRAIQSSDVIIQDESGKEVYRQKSSDLGGLALDLHLGYVF